MRTVPSRPSHPLFKPCTDKLGFCGNIITRKLPNMYHIKEEEKKIKETFNLKLNAYLLLTIIPLSILGYYFAASHESLFFLYEWLLSALVIFSILFSIKNIVSIRNEMKWVAVSILAFLLQFSVLGLFLGPLTHYPMFNLYFVFALLAFVVFIITFFKINNLRRIPIIFILITGLFTLYMMLLNSMWGNMGNMGTVLVFRN